jgi:hypothetical protein
MIHKILKAPRFVCCVNNYLPSNREEPVVFMFVILSSSFLHTEPKSVLFFCTRKISFLELKKGVIWELNAEGE